MGFEFVKSESPPLTRELAIKFRDMPGSPTERKLSSKRVADLQEKAAARKLVTFHWATADLDGIAYRVNGQHSSNMLSHLNGEFPQGLVVHIDHYKVGDKYALIDLFRSFDPASSARTKSDVAGAYQVTEGDTLKDVAREAAKLAIDGIVWHRDMKLFPTPRGDSKYSLMAERSLQPFLQWYGELAGIKATELKRVPIIAAMYATFSTNDAESTAFWHRVAKVDTDDIAGHEQDPDVVLDLWLLGIKEKKNPPKAAQLYQGAIYAWNAFRQQKQISEINAVVTKGKELRDPIE